MNDVRVLDLPVIQGEKGSIVKVFPAMQDLLGKSSLEEIYISSIEKNTIKGCKLHQRMTCRIKVISGEVTFHFFNPEKVKVQSVTLSDSQAKLMVIPPQTWFAFENRGSGTAQIINFSDLLHSPDEQINQDHQNFQWN